MISKQEMFDRAVRGLAAQRWRRAVDEHGKCQYMRPNGDRCAWGHVDPEGTAPVARDLNVWGLNVWGLNVWGLHSEGIGLAKELSTADGSLKFAEDLQACHDGAIYPEDGSMEQRFRTFMATYELTWPLPDEAAP